MRVSQNTKLLKIKQLLSRQRADLLNVSAEIWTDDEAKDKGIPLRIEGAVTAIERAIETIRAVTEPIKPPEVPRGRD